MTSKICTTTNTFLTVYQAHLSAADGLTGLWNPNSRLPPSLPHSNPIPVRLPMLCFSQAAWILRCRSHSRRLHHGRCHPGWACQNLCGSCPGSSAGWIPWASARWRNSCQHLQNTIRQISSPAGHLHRLPIRCKISSWKTARPVPNSLSIIILCLLWNITRQFSLPGIANLW